MPQTEIDFAHFRQRLDEMRTSIQGELDRLQEETSNVDQETSYGVKNHPAEDATELEQRERNMAIRGEMEREIGRIEHALARIDEGTYGVCEVGGELIPVERLEARPAATLCIRHQREDDAQSRDVPDSQV
jgi:RNA polymerase-binding protein DksA